MAYMGLELPISKLLIEGEKLNILEYMLEIAAIFNHKHQILH